MRRIKEPKELIEGLSVYQIDCERKLNAMMKQIKYTTPLYLHT